MSMSQTKIIGHEKNKEDINQSAFRPNETSEIYRTQKHKPDISFKKLEEAIRKQYKWKKNNNADSNKWKSQESVTSKQ